MIQKPATFADPNRLLIIFSIFFRKPTSREINCKQKFPVESSRSSWLLYTRPHTQKCQRQTAHFRKFRLSFCHGGILERVLFSSVTSNRKRGWSLGVFASDNFLLRNTAAHVLLQLPVITKFEVCIPPRSEHACQKITDPVEWQESRASPHRTLNRIYYPGIPKTQPPIPIENPGILNKNKCTTEILNAFSTILSRF